MDANGSGLSFISRFLIVCKGIERVKDTFLPSVELSSSSGKVDGTSTHSSDCNPVLLT